MKRWRKNIRSLRHSNEMVSEIVGTVLLLAIAVGIFSTLYCVVLSYPFAQAQATVTIIGTVDGDDIILEHRGGEALGLETEVPITIAGEKLLIDGRTPTVGDLLIDSNGDGLWNIGERLVYKFTYDLSKLDADVMAIDVESNSLVLMGTIDIQPECDIGVKVTVDDKYPNNSTVLRIKATNYRGDINASNVTIKCKLPYGLIFDSYELSQGTYDSVTGIWDIGYLSITKSATLNITVNVMPSNETTPTQLALLLDGSGSITPADWTIMCNGIALAITDGYIPHNGQVELTVIQFGGDKEDIFSKHWAWAQVELGGPIVLNNTNYLTVASDIQAINQLSGYTAMSCAFRLAADIMSGDPNNKLSGTPFKGMASKHSDWPRQVVNLVTDGQPNVTYNDAWRYKGILQNNKIGKVDTESALTYYESLRPIEDDDEIDSEAVGDDTDQTWLRDHIVRPQPGYDDWPPTDSGWVRYVDNYTEFANTIGEQFKLIFNNVPSIVNVNVEKVGSIPLDPNAANNKVSISIILPQN